MAYKNAEDKLAWQRARRLRATVEERERKAEYNRKYQQENRERILELQRAWRAANADAKRDYAKQYHARNRERELRRMREYKTQPAVAVHIRAAASEYKRSNRDRCSAAEANRKAIKKVAGSVWFGEFDAFVMQEAANLCTLRKLTTSVLWQVDHIVPLVSKRVCGLHVAANFAVIPATHNQSKGNRHWPQMP
jgi:hypothetical protein